MSSSLLRGVFKREFGEGRNQKVKKKDDTSTDKAVDVLSTSLTSSVSVSSFFSSFQHLHIFLNKYKHRMISLP